MKYLTKAMQLLLRTAEPNYPLVSPWAFATFTEEKLMLDDMQFTYIGLIAVFRNADPKEPSYTGYIRQRDIRRGDIHKQEARLVSYNDLHVRVLRQDS